MKDLDAWARGLVMESHCNLPYFVRMKKQETMDEFISEKLDPEKIKEAASCAAEEAARFVRKHPLECVGAALVVGMLMGFVANKK